MLFGSCGSWIFHSALRRACAPPRAGWRGRRRPTSRRGRRADTAWSPCSTGFAAGDLGVICRRRIDRASTPLTLPRMSCRPHGFGFFLPTFWYLKSEFFPHQQYSPIFGSRHRPRSTPSSSRRARRIPTRPRSAGDRSGRSSRSATGSICSPRAASSRSPGSRPCPCRSSSPRRAASGASPRRSARSMRRVEVLRLAQSSSPRSDT